SGCWWRDCLTARSATSCSSVPARHRRISPRSTGSWMSIPVPKRSLRQGVGAWPRVRVIASPLLPHYVAAPPRISVIELRRLRRSAPPCSPYRGCEDLIHEETGLQQADVWRLRGLAHPGRPHWGVAPWSHAIACSTMLALCFCL